MLILQTPSDFHAHIGQTIGTSDWLTIDQDRIDAFARATGDDFWIHVDVERAKREMPGGKTIAHGLLMLGLVPLLQRQIFRVERRGKGLNYGSDRVRYTAQVPVGSQVRLMQSVRAVEKTAAGTRVTTDCVIELQGSERPAVVAEFILLLQDG
jgi:acyl dehydratase